jgi:hypothetical protein
MAMHDFLEVMALALRQFHSTPRSRKELEHVYGQVWNEVELHIDFEVLGGFTADSVDVRHKSDGQEGCLGFQDKPRFYFSFLPKLVL